MPLKLLELQSDAEFDALVRCQFAAYDTPPNKHLNLFFAPQASREATIQSAVLRQRIWHRADPTSRWVKVVDSDDPGRILGGAHWHIFYVDPYSQIYADESKNMMAVFPWYPAGEERDIATTLMHQFMEPWTRSMRKPHVCKY